MPRFEPGVRAGVRVNVSQNVTANLLLKLAGAVQTVSVGASDAQSIGQRKCLVPGDRVHTRETVAYGKVPPAILLPLMLMDFLKEESLCTMQFMSMTVYDHSLK
jgi:hypothetical protein